MVENESQTQIFMEIYVRDVQWVLFLGMVYEIGRQPTSGIYRDNSWRISLVSTHWNGCEVMQTNPKTTLDFSKCQMLKLGRFP